jgi:hypothetical protein
LSSQLAELNELWMQLKGLGDHPEVVRKQISIMKRKENSGEGTISALSNAQD